MEVNVKPNLTKHNVTHEVSSFSGFKFQVSYKNKKFKFD